MISIEQAIERFESELPEEVQLMFEAEEVLEPLHALEKAYGVTLSPLCVYIAIGEVKLEGIGQYLETELDLPAADGQKLATALHDKIFAPLIERIRFLNAYPEKEMTLDQEKNVAERAFRASLVAELRRDPVLTQAFNMRLFFILARESDFAKRLEQALYDNEEKLTEHDISVNGEAVPPTVGNWIKDYVARYGSQAHDSVSQSSFLINSDNVKSLDLGARELVAKALKTYINIKFFPDSMPSDDGTGWEIIPVDASPEVSSPPTRQALVEEETPPRPAPALPQTDPARDAVPPAPANLPIIEPSAPAAVPNEEIEGLKNMLLQYPVGSLERRAIEEEIKKLEIKT